MGDATKRRAFLFEHDGVQKARVQKKEGAA